MRIGALAIAWFLGAGAMPAAGAPILAPEQTPYNRAQTNSGAPFPGSALAPAGAAVAPPDVRSYAPSPAAKLRPETIRAEPSIRPEPPRMPHARICFNQAETREKIAQRRLADPVRAIRAGRAEGEALRTRLCRWKGDDLLYEVYVLRRDGHVVRFYMNAQNGDSLSAADASDHK